MESKQQKFYGKVKDFYELESIEDTKMFYTAFNQFNKINTIDKDPSFYMDDIIEEAQKIGMAAEEVWNTVMEVCNAFELPPLSLRLEVGIPK
ncbi:hypothetical protein AAHB51_29705 [Bacillus cereus]|nr:hypothetical protein [Bacillus sp. OR9]